MHSATPRNLLIAGGLLGAVALAAAVIHAGASASLEASRAASYRALLDAQTARLQQWIDERRADVEQLASDPEIIRLAGRMIRAGENPCADEAGHLAVATEVLTYRFGRRAPTVLHVLDASGRVLMSNRPGYCGTRLPDEVRARLVLARERGSAFVRPMEGDPHPFAWFEAPVRGTTGAPSAFIGIGVDASSAFRFLAESGRFGQTGEIYLVDGERRPLSALRQPPSAIPMVGTPLFARMAAARAGMSDQLAGEVMKAYVGHAGTEVVGVWRWLPRRGVGLVLEVAASEAYGPLRVLHLAVWLLAGLAAAVLATGLALRHIAGRDGERIGPYRILGLLGEGAVSNVHHAEHVPMRRQVALKVLKPHAATDEWIARFRREVQLAGGLVHPNFVRIHDYGHTPDTGFYCAMEYLKGRNFAELVEQDGPQPASRVAWMLAEICEALAEAHGKGILHRDIKPQNLMLCEIAGSRDAVKVLDFGIVKQIDGDNSRDLTVGLRILGTPAYLAPERITDPGGSDPRSDLYAVGAVGFFLLTGHRPFESENDIQLTHRILHEPAPRASALASGVPAELDDLIARCLEKSADARPASARELADALRRIAG